MYVACDCHYDYDMNRACEHKCVAFDTTYFRT